MCDGIVIRLRNGGETCISIPVPYGIPPIPKDPWPPEHNPWRDLHILATINELVSGLGHENIRTQVSAMLHDSAKLVVDQLPEEFEVGNNFMMMSSKAAAD